MMETTSDVCVESETVDMYWKKSHASWKLVRSYKVVENCYGFLAEKEQMESIVERKVENKFLPHEFLKSRKQSREFLPPPLDSYILLRRLQETFHRSFDFFLGLFGLEDRWLPEIYIAEY